MKCTVIKDNQRYSFRIKAFISSTVEKYDEADTLQEFRFDNELAYNTFIDSFDSLINNTGAILDEFAQTIISNYNRILEEKVEEPIDKTKNIEIKMPITELDDPKNIEEVTEIHPLIEDEGNKE